MTQQKHDNEYRVLGAEAEMWAARTAEPAWRFIVRIIRLLKQVDLRLSKLERRGGDDE